jgi:hypothetical protein
MAKRSGMAGAWAVKVLLSGRTLAVAQTEVRIIHLHK